MSNWFLPPQSGWPAQRSIAAIIVAHRRAAGKLCMGMATDPKTPSVTVPVAIGSSIATGALSACAMMCSTDAVVSNEGTVAVSAESIFAVVPRFRLMPPRKTGSPDRESEGTPAAADASDTANSPPAAAASKPCLEAKLLALFLFAMFAALVFICDETSQNP
ncbi:MAG: hypothetical protein J0I98_14815 [Mesorhizobium sp.]|nr:hypothetical protein [Mesorhizobium sp.]MBN9244061.1 hypothetical protein [Mesorhizobium sp.]